MRTFLRYGLPGIATLLLVAPAIAQIVVIDNGSAPPDPANVLTSTTGSEDLRVRDGGCGGEPLPCPSPGPPTTVEVQSSLLSLLVADSSTVIASGGVIDDLVFALNDAQLEVDGALFVETYGRDQATILLSSGGGTGFSSNLNMEEFSTLVMSGGFVDFLTMTGASSATITGGSTGAGLQIGEQAQALISGGSIGTAPGSEIRSRDESTVTVTGTGGFLITQLFAEDDSVIRISGANFQVDGEPVGYGVLEASSGTLTGDLRDGGVVDSFFQHQVAGTTGTIVLVPEPATAVLLAGGLMALSRLGRRTQRAC